MKKITSIILLILFLISNFCLFNGCDNNKSNSNQGQNVVEQTSNFIVKDGKSDYKVITPKNAQSNIESALSEFVGYFNEATGIMLETIRDDSLQSISEQDKYIIIGQTSFAKNNNLIPTVEEVGHSGYVIKTVGNCIYIVGGSEVGSRFGVYEFLNYILEFDYFYEGIYSLKKNVVEIPLMKYDIKIIPDFEFNDVQFEPLNNNEAFRKMSMYNTPVSAIGGLTGHASMGYIPKDEFLNENDPDNYHPKWYMRDLNGGDITQLCYTARGDKKEYELLVKAAASKIQEVMRNNPLSFYFDFSMTDDDNWCDCETCQEIIKRHYGANIAVQIPFLNDLSDYIKNWFKTEEGKQYERKFYIKAYAYWTTLEPPLKYNASTGKYTVADDSVFCNDNVIIQVADLQADYTRSMFHDVNRPMYELYRDWSYLCPHMSAYIYCTRYADDLQPFDTFNDMQEYYKYFKSIGVTTLHNYGHNRPGYSTGWNSLKMYLGKKLGIDVNIDFNKTVDKFFDNVYLGASKTMKQLFNEWRYIDEYNTQTHSNYAGRTVTYKSILNEKYFSKPLLERWNGLIEKSLSEIEYLKDIDMSLYNKTYKMIVGERVWINYLHYQIYGVVFKGTDTVKEFSQQLVHDIQFLGIRFRGPSKTIDDLVKAIKEG